MRNTWLLGLAGLVAGCTDGLAARQAQLAQWVGRPETDLVGILGAPTRVYETDGTKFLTYDDRRVEIQPAYFGPGPFWYGGGFPPTATTLECNTTFTVAGGVVRAYSLRGNACG
jgi:hypothetical protein